jgi:hypothetical protein
MKQTVKDILDTPLAERQSVMAIMVPYDDPEIDANPAVTPGDYKVVWDSSKPDEVEHARDTFNRWKKKGYMAYEVTGKDARKGSVVNEFDPDAQTIIFAPPLRGGM